MKKKPPGLYANIQAKRARGEKMRKPGEEGAPSAGDFKNAAKTAKKKKGAKRQDPGFKMYDKDGCKKCSGDKKDMVGRKSGYADGYGKKCDSIAAEFNAVMDTEAREDKPCGASFIPQNAKCSKGSAGAKAKKYIKKGGKEQFSELSDKQKEKVIRKAAKGPLKNASRKTIKEALERNKGNTSVEGRTMKKAAKRELFNRNVRNVAAVGLYGGALAALAANEPNIGGMAARANRRKRRGL